MTQWGQAAVMLRLEAKIRVPTSMHKLLEIPDFQLPSLYIFHTDQVC